MSQFRTTAVVDGACPFHAAAAEEPQAKKQRLETAAPASREDATPATHFALAAGPASDTAVLLPFAQHRWHSRLVAALRDDARETHGEDLSTAAAFVLVALPEQARPKVFDLLVKVLELRREDRHTETGLPDEIPSSYKALFLAAFPSYRARSGLDPATIAALCQLCRLSEFIQLSIGVDLACSYIAPWVVHVRDSNSEFLPFVRTALQGMFREDNVSASLTKSDGSPRHSRQLHPDSDLLAGLQGHASTVYIGRAPVGEIPKMFFDILPPGAIPGAVLDSRLQCYLPDSDASVPVCCGTASTSRSVVYVTAATEACPRHGKCSAIFGSGPEAVDDFRRLATASAFHWMRLPPGLTADDLKSTLIKTARRATLPPDVCDDNIARFLEACVQMVDLDMSMTTITTIPPRCFLSFKNLRSVNLPPTLRTIGSLAFPESVKEVTGVGPGVDVASLAFLFPTQVRDTHPPI